MKYRYPGIQSFTNEDQSLFFGRDREIKELFRLIELNPLIVVFGKSGIGKTSLLQAGVAPVLETRFLYPAKIRFNNIDQSISKQIYEQLNEKKLLPGNTPDDLSLWEYCHHFLYVAAGEVHTPVLVLDQFEELFTLYQDQPQVQQDFIAQMAAVINRRPPENFPKKEWAAHERAQYATPPNVHIVISIRSDYLYILDRLSDQIPSILRCRYELNALDENNARLAITQPALLPQYPAQVEYGMSRAPFSAAPFRFSSAALSDIIDNLTLISERNNPERGKATLRTEVEAFQLQLLCRSIEEKIITNHCPPDFEVLPDFYGGEKGIAVILTAFYSSVLKKFEPDSRLKIQLLVEEKLLSGGRRILQEKEFLIRECGIEDADLLQLSTERLIKEEPRGGSFYYEISHDTLVPPILEARDKRQERELIQRQKEEQRANAQKLQEAEAKAKEEAEKRAEAERLQNKAEIEKRRARLFAAFSMIVAIVVVVLMVQLFITQGKLIKSEHELEKNVESLSKSIAARDSIEADKVMFEVRGIIKRYDDLKNRHPEIAAEIKKDAVRMLDSFGKNPVLQARRKELGL